MSIEKPEIDFPGGEPPTDLQISEVWEGTGAEAKAGDMVQVHYVGVAFSTGEQFDASWDRGVQGMKVGGRRQLIIPPDLAYGDRGAGRDIKPGETLIFVCDLVSA
jgi:peptidylprolyl isomerase